MCTRFPLIVLWRGNMGITDAGIKVFMGVKESDIQVKSHSADRSFREGFVFLLVKRALRNIDTVGFE